MAKRNYKIWEPEEQLFLKRYLNIPTRYLVYKMVQKFNRKFTAKEVDSMKFQIKSGRYDEIFEFLEKA